MIRFITVYMILGALTIALGCTIGIATGSKTVDGRPLLFKNKDTINDYPPDVDFYQGIDGEYSYVFQKTYGQDHTRARMGINSVGFGILYSDSENLPGAGTGPSGSHLSAIALKTCATLDDFRALLDSTNGARRSSHHFGVIDSTGSGSMFEVDGYSYFELPVVDSVATMANTARYHPSAGDPAGSSTSLEREARATYLLTHGPAAGLDFAYFVQEISQDYCHNQAWEDAMPLGQYQTNPVLSRYKTSVSCVIHGSKPGDDPLIESVMWLIMGEPSSSVALPFIPNAGAVFDFVRPASAGEGMPGSSDRVRRHIYDYTNGRYDDQYADTYVLEDVRSTTFAIEDSLFHSYNDSLAVWRYSTAPDLYITMRDWTFAHQQWAKAQYDALEATLKTGGSPIGMVTTYRLHPNYPNPFNPTTTIRYDLPKAVRVWISVYNLNGREVRHLVDEYSTPGFYDVVWNGRDQAGRSVTSGVYIAIMYADGKILTRKMVLLK